MSSFAERFALLALTVLAGCYDSHLCDSPELCNYRDDDCDDQADEGFVDALTGAYDSPQNCGGCGIDCAAQFPGALETTCDASAGDGTATCRVVVCLPDFELIGGTCLPRVPALCMPCTEDADCALRVAGAACLMGVNGERRCGEPCELGCAPGFACGASGQCEPTTGSCACTPELEGTRIGCLLDRGDGYRCAGVRVCTADGFGDCEPAGPEACNAQDDDCDGASDEDFVDGEGRYVSRFHCGGCGIPCAPPGPHMIAECVTSEPLPEGLEARCDVRCEEGFVDVDEILATGCECERFDGDGPPPVVGGDSDCDGIADDTDDFVYVTSTGSDTNPGTLVRPMRSIQAALERGAMANKDVLVARGVYDGTFELAAGVSVFGGYSPDFRERDFELYPVLVENRDALPGSPVLVCRQVTAATRVEGIIVAATDATAAGEGSTAIYFDRCTSAVQLRSVTVLAGRGADGARGSDSSDALGEGGLSQLDGVDGSGGRVGTSAGLCTDIAGGTGGANRCEGVDVGGGNGGAAGCPDAGCVQGSPCGNGGCTDYTVGGVCDFASVMRDAVGNAPASGGRGPGGGAAGEVTYNAPTNRRVCNFCDDNPTLPRTGGNGVDGREGADGGGGEGCTTAPVIDIVSGQIHGENGGGGGPGANGAGGGGGTAGSGYYVIDGTDLGCADRAGGSGGGGGSGGCGAPAATGGGGGGASIGIVVRSAGADGPTFEDVRIVTASGGRGGDGGIGANGGAGGSGANGGAPAFWCSRTGGRGGDGGRGGAGGGGGGGCGGSSHGVYVVGASTAYVTGVEGAVVVEESGVAGAAGNGGFSPGMPGAAGQTGVSDPVFGR